MKTKPLINFRIVHAAGLGKRTVVKFNRHNHGMRAYRPARASVRRLARWLEKNAFSHDFSFGTHVISVFIKPEREEQ